MQVEAQREITEATMKKQSRKVTLFDVIASVQACTPSDAEAVAVITHLLDSGQVLLRHSGRRRKRTPLLRDLAA